MKVLTRKGILKIKIDTIKNDILDLLVRKIAEKSSPT
jgi:hypothetical protein